MEEREEGELTDDFEEVSDCSMSPGSPLNCGKSVTAELLSDVSLSSVGSEKEYNNARMIYERNTRRYYQRNQRLLSSRGFRRKRKMSTLSPAKTNHVKRRRRSLLHHSDSDDDSLDPKYVKKLREALHHETPCTLLHSSLKTRLKGFIKPGSQSDEDDESELRDIALSTCALGENEKDTHNINSVKNDENEEKKTEDFELQQLRIDALRSFVMENHKKRKNKAAVTESKEGVKVEKVNDDVNKENDQGVINNEEKKEPEKDEMSNGSCEVDLIEEDVDILRTMLLASMSTKLIEKTKVEDAKATDNKLNPVVKVDIKLQQPNDKKVNNFLPNKVVVKPLIINVGDSDSDSDTEVVTKDEPTTESVVAEFLKRQRAKVEAKENEIKLKTEMTVLKKNPTAPAFTSSIVNTPSNTKKPYDDFLLDKSEVKLLPRSQQLEYRKLKMQLLNATRKKFPLKRSSFTKRENNSPLVNLNAKKVPKFIKNDATNLNSKSGVVNGNIDFRFKPQDRKCINSTQDLQRTLDGLQIRRNGRPNLESLCFEVGSICLEKWRSNISKTKQDRLQIKGKYQSLQPLLNKINRASHDRMLNEKEIKILLQKLQQAKSRFSQTDQQFTNLVQQLVNGKSVIDQRIFKLRAFNASTTKKVNVVPLVHNGEAIIEKVEEEKNLVESKNVDCITVDTNLISGKNICDSNDVVQDVPQSSVGVSSFTKYTSPLDNRCQISDPQAIMCPYDLLGVCKDKECGYLHC